MLAEFFKTHEAGLEWLVPVLCRHAATSYEQAGFTREAADCWAEAHESSRAAGLYLREGDYARAAQLLFEAGRYAEALEQYRRWASLQLPESKHFVIARLGEAACLTLLRSDRSAARAAYRVARSRIEACDELLQRDIHSDAGQARALVAAGLWEALGAYGRHVGRDDLLQLGYERALVRYGEQHNTERVRAARAYLAAAGANRLLAQEVEARLAEWDKTYSTEKDARRIVLVRQGRTFRLGDRVRLTAGAGTFKPQDTGHQTEIFANAGHTGIIMGSAGADELRVKWDAQKFSEVWPGHPEKITHEDFQEFMKDESRNVMLDSFESAVAARFLAVVVEPLTRFWINQRVLYERDRSWERREWVRTSPTKWEQRYTDGTATEFGVAGLVEVEGEQGTVVVKHEEQEGGLNSPTADTTLADQSSIQIFIPDRDNRKPWLRMRHIRSVRDERWEFDEWRDLAEMHFFEDDAARVAQGQTEMSEGHAGPPCPGCAKTRRVLTTYCVHCGCRLADEDALLGTVLDGKYRLIQHIGSGRCTSVYRAIEEPDAGREYAIKILTAPRVEDRVELRRFFHVAEVMRSLQHPNVVRVYDWQTARPSTTLPAVSYYVMELVEGELLLDVLRGEGASGLGLRAAHLMREICHAVGEAHRQNILHENLRPKSIFVLPVEQAEFSQRVKVMDFGYYENPKVADTISSAPEENRVSYMSPEQCRADALDARADVYSLGILLYEMIAGTLPFIADTALRVARKHLEEMPPPFRPELGVSRPLEAVVRKALAKDPDERQADANALAHELQEVLTLAGDVGFQNDRQARRW